MKTRLSWLYSAVFFGALGASAEVAVPAGPDTDGDGIVTFDELQEFRVTRTFESDTDGDGALTLEEFRPTLPARMPRMLQGRAFGRIDADGDGQVVPEELRVAPVPAFEQADADGDGRLDAEELARLRDR